MASRHAQRAKDTYWNERTFGMVETLRSIAAELSERTAASHRLDAVASADHPYQVFMGGVLTGRYDSSAGPPDDSHMASRHARGQGHLTRGPVGYIGSSRIPVPERAYVRAWSSRSDLSRRELKDEVSVPWSSFSLPGLYRRPQITSVIVHGGASRPSQVREQLMQVNHGPTRSESMRVATLRRR